MDAVKFINAIRSVVAMNGKTAAGEQAATEPAPPAPQANQ